MYCSGCGFSLAGQEACCPRCGKPNAVPPIQLVPRTAQVTSVEQRLWQARVGVAIGCFILAVILMSTLQTVAGLMSIVACILFAFGWSSKSIPYKNKLLFVFLSVVFVSVTQWGELASLRKQAAERQAEHDRKAAQRAREQEEAFNSMTPDQHLAVAQANLAMDGTDEQIAEAKKNIAALKGTPLKSKGDALLTGYEAQKAKAEAKAKAAQAKAEAQARAQEAAYSNSRAGRLCAKHPSWSRDDCEGIGNHKVWIGMSLEMLKANRGRPNHANPSNYGNGTQWQWCWDDYTPSCFYGEDDGIITAYN